MSLPPNDMWERIEALLDEAFDLEPEPRRALLKRACTGDPEMRREVERLLHAEEDAPAFLEEHATDFVAPLLAGEASDEESEGPSSGRIGQRIGAWRLTRELGRGGMGVVYLAERAGGDFRQAVALKLIKRGMDSDAILARFLNERRVLADLQHPHIARLIDGGATDDGTPWFAMEYVDGMPITDYCSTHGLSTDERVALFVKVCRAVTHAHNRLIIHRDLKPSNILVTEPAPAKHAPDHDRGAGGEPHLLDFGLAKVLQDPSGDEPTTRTGGRWLTLDYASPEQVRGETIGTPSDTYQLGLILYEILTGKRPYSVKSLSSSEAERVICEKDPSKPSAVVATDRLRRRLKGDLDTIILKALHKDPERGYASAEILASDLERHLNDLPIEAQADTLGYRTGKFARRHRWGVATTVALILLTVGFFALHTARVTAERDLAQLEREKAEEVIGYLTSLFEASDPSVAQGDTITARELLEQGIERAKALDNQPRLQATLFRITGDINLNLGNVKLSEELHRKALATWQKTGLHSENSEEYLRTLFGLGLTLYLQDRDEEAVPLFRQVINQRTREDVNDELLQNAYFNLYSALHAEGQTEAAKETFAAWETTFDQVSASPDPETADRMIKLAENLGYQAQMRGDLDAIERGKTLATRALRALREERGPNHPSVAFALRKMTGLLTIELDRRPNPEALALANSLSLEAVELHRTLYEKPSIQLLLCLYNRAEVLRHLGHYDAAEQTALEARDIAEIVVGKESNLWVAAEGHLARIELDRGNYARAVQRFSRFRNGMARRHGDNNVFTLNTELLLGMALTGARRFEEAETRLALAYETLETQRGRQDPYTQRALRHLVALYDSWGKPERAAEYRALLPTIVAEDD